MSTVLSRSTFVSSVAIATFGSSGRASARGKRLGTVGLVLPTHTPAFMADLSLFLPPGVAMMPTYLGVTSGTRQEFAAVLPAYEKCVALLADQSCDLISANGAPPFMVQGYAREHEIVRDWERKYKTPIVTSPQDQVEALRALGVSRFVGVTPLSSDQSPLYAKYFTDAGFQVLGMEALNGPFSEVKTLSTEAILAFIKTSIAKHSGAEAIYILGSEWRSIDVVEPLEREMGVPVLNPVIAIAWGIQKRLRLQWPVKGYGRLIADLP